MILSGLSEAGRGDPARFVECVSISPADGASFLASRSLSPALPPRHPTPDLDTPDERALHALLLGIMHRTLRLYAPAPALLEAVVAMTRGRKYICRPQKMKELIFF
jgi:hypothetical protein